jgi:hypothetical protein
MAFCVVGNVRKRDIDAERGGTVVAGHMIGVASASTIAVSFYTVDRVTQLRSAWLQPLGQLARSAAEPSAQRQLQRRNVLSQMPSTTTHTTTLFSTLEGAPNTTTLPVVMPSMSCGIFMMGADCGSLNLAVIVGIGE